MREPPDGQATAGDTPHTDAGTNPRPEAAAGSSSPGGTILRSNVDRQLEARLASIRAPDEPAVSESYRYAWQILKRQFWRLLLVSFIWAIFEVPAWLLTETPGFTALDDARRQLAAFLPPWATQNLPETLLPSGFVREWLRQVIPEDALSFVYTTFIEGPIFYGLSFAYLRAAKGERPRLGDLFAPFRHVYVASVVSSFLAGELSAIGTVLLVIPGIVVAVRLAFVPFLVVQERAGSLGSLRASWRRTREYGWTIFFLWLRGAFTVALGALALVLGAIPMLMWVLLAHAALFTAIDAQQQRREAGVRASSPGPATPA